MADPHMPDMQGAVNDTLGFVKNLWGSMGVPGMAAPTLSVDDLDKKIAELKAVEGWLNVNTAMLRGTIQTLEVQRGTLAALSSMGEAMANAVKQSTAGAAAPAPGAGTTTGADPFANPAAWWNMLQGQFNQAVAGAMATPAAAPAPSAAADAAGKAPRSSSRARGADGR